MGLELYAHVKYMHQFMAVYIIVYDMKIWEDWKVTLRYFPGEIL